MKDQVYPAWRWIVDVVLALAIVPLFLVLARCLIVAYLIFHPPRKRTKSKLQTSLDFESLRVKSTDGMSLSALLTVPENAKACIVICHEWGNHKASKLKYAEMVHANGCAALLFELRNHGESTRDKAWSDMGRRYTDDLASVIAQARQDERIRSLPLLVLAFSFSTFAAVHCVARGDGEGVDGLILDSGPPYDEHDIAHRFLCVFSSQLLPRWMRGPVLRPFAFWIAEKLIIRLAHEGQWPPKPEQLTKPMLVIGGTADDVVPESQLRTLIDHAPNAELHVVQNCPHLRAFKEDGEHYRDWINGFVDRVIVNKYSGGAAAHSAASSAR